MGRKVKSRFHAGEPVRGFRFDPNLICDTSDAVQWACSHGRQPPFNVVPMIIYGTGMFNRRDHSLVRATCPSCGRSGYQKSYTCSRFFTVYWIPVIPLGRFKVTTECPHCGNALGMPYRKWEGLRKADLTAAVATYERSPSDEAAANAALGIIASLQSRPSLLRVGPVVRSHFGRNAPMMARLADAYSYLCMDKQADETFLHAISLSDDPELAKQANAHLEQQSLPKPKPPHRLVQSLPVLIVPALLLFGFATFAQKAVTAGIEEGYVVNGLDRAYTVELNGETVTLAPNQRIRTDLLVYGVNVIEPSSKDPFIVAERFHVDVPWYRRAFATPVVIVNPDRASLIIWERTGYAYPTPPDNSHQIEFMSGRAAYVYDTIDFPFLAFPSTIDVSSSGVIKYRTRVSELRELNPQQVANLFIERNDTDSLLGYLRGRLQGNDDSLQAVFLGSSLLPRDEFLGLARSRLADRPARVQWHRAYQGLMQYTPEGRNLESEYRELARSAPNDSLLTYLHARVIEDADERRETFERALALPNPTGYAAHALAYFHLLEGDYARAVNYSEEALRLEPKNPQFSALRHSALYGTGNLEEIERETSGLLAGETPLYADFHQHIYRLGRLGQVERARTEIGQFMQKVEKDAPQSPQDRAQGVAYLESALALAAKDKGAYVKAISGLDTPFYHFQKAVLTGDLEGAIRIAHLPESPLGVLDRLTLYVVLARSSRLAMAHAQLPQAVAAMKDGGADLRRWSEWLLGSEPPDARTAAHACEDVDHHFVYLIALAQKHPNEAAGYLQRARAVRHRDSFYSLALESALAAETASSTQ